MGADAPSLAASDPKDTMAATLFRQRKPYRLTNVCGGGGDGHQKQQATQTKCMRDQSPGLQEHKQTINVLLNTFLLRATVHHARVMKYSGVRNERLELFHQARGEALCADALRSF